MTKLFSSYTVSRPESNTLEYQAVILPSYRKKDEIWFDNEIYFFPGQNPKPAKPAWFTDTLGYANGKSETLMGNTTLPNGYVQWEG